MSNRKNWEFEYTAGDLAQAATAKKAFHEETLVFWKQKKNGVVAEVKEKGLEVSESLADLAYTSNLSGGMGARLVVKNEYQEQLNECHAKIVEHTTKVKEYDGWIQMLEANSKNRISLDIDDYLFFYGR